MKGRATSVTMSEETKQRLASCGNTDESFEDVINKLVDFYVSKGVKKK